MEYIRVLLDNISCIWIILIILRRIFYFEIRSVKITAAFCFLSPILILIAKYLLNDNIAFSFISFVMPIIIGSCCVRGLSGLLYSTCIEFMLSTIAGIIQTMLSIVYDLLGIVDNKEVILIITIAIVFVLFNLFVLLVQDKYITRKHRFSAKFLVCVCMIALIGFVIYNACTNILYDTQFYDYDQQKIKLFLIFFGAALLIEIIVVCYLYFEKTHYSIAVDYAEEYFEMQKEYFLKIDELNNDIRRFRHDNQNYINILNSYAESNDFPAVKKYLSEISEQLPKSKVKIRTKDFIFNSLIEQKYGIMMNNGIEFNTDIQISELRKIEDFPFCTIFSNALQNAIEACLACPEGKRYINVKYHINDSVLILSVANSVSTKVIIKNNRIKTSKKDKKNHGIGLFQIKNAVEKLKGHCKLTCTDEEFVISVVLDNK